MYTYKVIEVREKMLGCMSSRAADSIRDEMEEKGPMHLAEVLEAQKEVIGIARRLADAGTIMLKGRGDDYVESLAARSPGRHPGRRSRRARSRPPPTTIEPLLFEARTRGRDPAPPPP